MQKVKRILVLIGIQLIFNNFVFSQKVGVVLSGGGAAGTAHVGVLKALEENDIPIDYIVGTSIGAIVGAFYASGYSPEEIEAIMLSQDFQEIASGITEPRQEFFFKKSESNPSILNFNFNLDSVFSSNLPTNFVSSSAIDYSLMEIFSPATAASNNNFDSLMIPFRCLAANITKRKEKIFRQGDLSTAVRASMTFPFYIAPISIDGDLMFDGGIYNNFPVSVLCEEFEVDYIIASNVADESSNPKEDDLFSQLRSFFMQPANFEIPCAKGIIINSDVQHITTFDFYQSGVALQSGYVSTNLLMDSIKKNVTIRRSGEINDKKRAIFNEKKPNLKYGDITFQNYHKRQVKYFKATLESKEGIVQPQKFKKEFFKLNSNEKILSIQPVAKFNKITGAFDVDLKVKKNKKFDAAFGGVIASNPFSSGFFELGYKTLKSTEIRATGNVYFGNFYNSAQAKVRWDVPFDLPLYISSQFTINRFDYFGNGSFLIEESNPPFIIASERFWNINLGLPILNQGKMVLGTSLFWQEDEYHQTDNFRRTDTADFTKFNGQTNFIKFQVNTLNRKQFATKGSRMELRLNHISGKETTTPGTLTNIPEVKRENREWIELNLQFERYFLKKSAFHFGTSLEMNYSDMPLFQNYKATLLRSNSFSPILVSETRFIESLRARTYIGAGIKAIYSIRDYIDFRAEAHLFQPYETFIKNENGSTDLNEANIQRNLIGTFSVVYHTRVGPLAVSLNYFDNQSPSLSFLVHYGYILFNNRALR